MTGYRTYNMAPVINSIFPKAFLYLIELEHSSKLIIII